jgi:hypothetical protein
MTAPTSASTYDRLFDYLEKEMAFQAAISAVSGAAGAWLVSTLLFNDPQKVPSVLRAQVTLIGLHISPGGLAKIGAGCLAMAALLFLTHRGQLARHYGEMAKNVATGESIELDNVPIRRLGDPHAVRAQWQYYTARLLFTLGCVALVILALVA